MYVIFFRLNDYSLSAHLFDVVSELFHYMAITTKYNFINFNYFDIACPTNDIFKKAVEVAKIL
jgi:hypothetical protein